MNLGLPYKGSKNTIAFDIVNALPRGKKFIDACCGGGAILMAAAMSGRWEKVVGNDLNPATIALLDAVLIHKGQNMAASFGSTGKKEGLEKLYFNGSLEQYRELMGKEYKPLNEEKTLDLFEERVA